MSELPQPVLIVGTGLLGTSLGLALRRREVDVLLTDRNPEHLRTATGLGAGHLHRGEPVGLVVVAVPPDHVGAEVARSLTETDAIVTDVGSVKTAPLRALEGVAGLDRYAGSHPMAGSERSGPLAAVADALRRPAVGGHPARALVRHGHRRGRGARPARRCDRRPDDPRGARRGRGADVAPAAPAVGAGRRAARGRAHRPPGAERSGSARRDADRRGRPRDVGADRHRELRGRRRAAHPGTRPARRPDRRRQHRRPRSRSARSSRSAWPAPARSRASTAARRVPRGPCSSPSPTIPVSSPGCSPTPGRARSTSRTSTSTTTPARDTGLVELVVEQARADHLQASLESRGWETHR